MLTKELKKMKERVEPIPIELSENNTLLLYYSESSILRNLRYYPFIQLFVVVVFIRTSSPSRSLSFQADSKFSKCHFRSKLPNQ